MMTDDPMERYRRAIANLHSVMIYNDVESLVHEAMTKAYASSRENNEFICEYLEKAYRDILSGESDYPMIPKR